MNNNILNTDREELVARLIDRPESFTDEELEQVFADDECRALYDTAIQVMHSIEPNLETDVEAEWNRFSLQHKRFRRSHRKWWKVAAVVAVVLMSGLAYATIKQLMTQDTWSQKRVTESIINDDTTSKPADDKQDSIQAQVQATIEQPRVFENTPLDVLVGVLAEHYGMRVKVMNEDAGQLRLYYEWNPALSIEQVVDQLNTFEKVNITVNDNTLTIE